jgi:excisionase family DNA binding protein
MPARRVPLDPQASAEVPLYVRLPRRESELLDRAAGEQRVSKRQLVTELVSEHLAMPGPGELVRGRLALSELEPLEVLTLEQAAALLQVEPAAVAALAHTGEVPARRVGEQWRFSRAALIAWLAS